MIRTTSARSLVRRRLAGRVAVALCAVAVAVSLAPLVALVAYTTSRGIHALSVDFFTQSAPVGEPGAGISNAIVGSLIIVGLAALMAVPVGITTALFLLERRGRIAGEPHAELQPCQRVIAAAPYEASKEVHQARIHSSKL